MRDVTSELTPQEVIANLCLRAINRSYITWVPDWAHEMYKDEYHPIIYTLEHCGITNEVIKNLPEFKKMLPVQNSGEASK